MATQHIVELLYENKFCLWLCYELHVYLSQNSYVEIQIHNAISGGGDFGR